MIIRYDDGHRPERTGEQLATEIEITKGVRVVRGENQVGECPVFYRFDVCESAARSYVPRGVDMHRGVTGVVLANERIEVGNIVVRDVIEEKLSIKWGCLLSKVALAGNVSAAVMAAIETMYLNGMFITLWNSRQRATCGLIPVIDSINTTQVSD